MTEATGMDNLGEVPATECPPINSSDEGFTSTVANPAVIEGTRDVAENMEFTPHAGTVSCDPAPPCEIKLFVGRVPPTQDENTLKPLFEKYGEVKEVIVIRDKNSGKHKSSVFVKMASLCQADDAIRHLNNIHVIDQSMGPIQVKYATGEVERLGMSQTLGEPGVDQAKLFLGSIPKTISDVDIVTLFSPYGKVDEVYIMKDSNTGHGKGCAFVKFAYKEQAIHAIKSLSSKHTLEGCPRPIEVRFAESRSGQTSGTVSGNRMPATTAMSSGGVHVHIPNNSQPRVAGPWREYFTDEGKPYYHHEPRNHTQWERPPEFDALFGPPTAASTGDVSGPPGANIFIFHVPNEWTQRDLCNTFGVFGPILSARIATDKGQNRNRGFAFVSYNDIESAAAAVNHMNGFMALNKRLKVTIKKGEECHVQHLLNNNNNVNAGMGNAPGPMSMQAPAAAPAMVSAANPHSSQPWAGYGMANSPAAAVGAYGQPAGGRFTPY